MRSPTNAQELHDASVVIDGCSFFLRGANDRIRQSGVTAVNFTVPMPMDDLGDAIVRLREYYDIARVDPDVEIVWSTDDIIRLKEEGRFGVIVGCQNSRFIGTDLGLIALFQRLGLRVMQLTYNERNYVADGCMEPEDAGLSHFGARLVDELNQCGIVVDLSHCGVRSSFEAIARSRHPVIMSHVGMRAFVDSPRAVTDDQVRAVAESGGVVGVTSHPNFNWRGGTDRPSIEDFLDAIEHAIDVAGIDHVGVGTDHVVEPNGYPEWMKARLAAAYDPYGTQDAETKARFRQALSGFDPREDQLAGFGGMQDFPKITEGLLSRGHTEVDVAKLIGRNFLRVFTSVWREDPKALPPRAAR